jgi:hypothetical protein
VTTSTHHRQTGAKVIIIKTEKAACEFVHLFLIDPFCIRQNLILFLVLYIAIILMSSTFLITFKNLDFFRINPARINIV